MIVRLLQWLLERKYRHVYRGFGQKQIDEWLLSLNGEHGFKDYFKYRNHIILKTLGQGLEQKEYWINVGRRNELHYLIGLAAERLRKQQKDKGVNNLVNEKEEM